MPQLNAAQPIVREDRTMEQAFRDQMTRLGNNLPIIGTGSPEGVVDAPQFTLYINRIGTAGAIEYRKMLTDIAGNTKLGWLAV